MGKWRAIEWVSEWMNEWITEWVNEKERLMDNGEVEFESNLLKK